MSKKDNDIDFREFDPANFEGYQGFDSFDSFDRHDLGDLHEDYDGSEADNWGGRGRARHEDRVQRRQAKRDRRMLFRADRKERRLIIKQPKAPTPMVDTLNNSPSTEDQASQNNTTPEAQAETQITPYHEQVKTMINNGGYQTSPTDNVSENATRFLLMRQQDAINRQQAQLEKLRNEGMSEDEQIMHVQSPDEIEEDQIKEDAEEFGDSFDSFFPAVYGAIKSLGKKGIDKIKADREAKLATAKAQGAEIGAAQAKVESLQEQLSKGAKNYWPYIVLGIVVVGALVFTLMYMKKKKSA